jgi:malate/lactate dehydrogenase
LLKLSPRIHTLNLYDVVSTAGVKADISHISTGAKARRRAAAADSRCVRLRVAATQVRAFSGAAQLLDALSGCDLVVIPAGVPRKPGMTVRAACSRLAQRGAMLTRTCVSAARRPVQYQRRHRAERVRGACTMRAALPALA